MTAAARSSALAHQPIWVMHSHTIDTQREDDLWRAIGLARSLAAGPEPFVIAIDGRSGAGKSSLATRLLERITSEEGKDAAELFRLEDLYPGWEGLESGVDEYAAILGRVLRNEDATWHAWDWARNRREPRGRTLSAGANVIIAEGVGAIAPGHQEVRPHFGIWLHLESTIRRYRALTRDGDLYRPYWQVWAEQEERLFAR
ncbi:MAG: hypothetical protein L0G59_04200 [Kocuria sp.]|nr:hypothetical protein [Kocuria sp.]